MISQVAGFIRWQIEKEDGVNTMAGIVSDANSKQLLESLAEASENMSDEVFHRSHSMDSIIALDDHLTITGLYGEMIADKEASCPHIKEQDKDNAYRARWPL